MQRILEATELKETALRAQPATEAKPRETAVLSGCEM